MPRQARKDLDTPFIHVMIQGVNKEYIFYKQEYIEKYTKSNNGFVKDKIKQTVLKGVPKNTKKWV